MSRIGARLVGFEQLLLSQLQRTRQAAAVSALRLSTGQIVNSPADDPSAFLQVQLFEQRLSHIRDVQANVEVATSIGAEAQTTVDEIHTQLSTIREQLLGDEAGEYTGSERIAAQAAIDSAIQQIRTLTRTTIQGQRLLDGSANYTFSSLDSTQIRTVEVLSLSEAATISGGVVTPASAASVTYTGSGGVIDSGDASFVLTGRRGSTSIAVEDAESLTVVRDRVNAASHLTGIVADVSGNDLTLTTVDYGAGATLAIQLSSGSFDTTGTTAGTDAVVVVNGRSLSGDEVDGNVISYRNHGQHLRIELQAGFTGTWTTFSVDDDQVARFSLSTAAGDTARLALPGLFPEQLGGVSGVLSDLASGGAVAGLGSNTSRALRIVDEALGQWELVSGRVDAFADIVVGSTSRLFDELGDQLDTAALEFNRVDEEAEDSRLAWYESLGSNTVTALSIMRQFQLNVLGVLEQIAGL